MDNIVNPDIILPYRIYDENGDLVLLLEKECPSGRQQVLKYLFEKDVFFNSKRWNIYPETKVKLFERLSLLPEPSIQEIRDIIQQNEQKDLFLHEQLLKNDDIYKIALKVKSITEQGYRENWTKNEYLFHINNVLNEDEIVKVSLLINNFIGVIEPTKRMRRKGLDRLNYYWNKFITYQIQDRYLIKELILLNSNVHMQQMLDTIKKDKDEKFYKIENVQSSYCNKNLTFNIGYGENLLPKELCPILVNPDYFLRITFGSLF